MTLVEPINASPAAEEPPTSATIATAAGRQHALPALPITRVNDRWHLAVGRSSIAIDDEAVTRDLDTLSALLAPAPAVARGGSDGR